MSLIAYSDLMQGSLKGTARVCDVSLQVFDNQMQGTIKGKVVGIFIFSA